MNKKLLVLAVAALLPMSAAQADVTIYGKVHASIDWIDPDSDVLNDDDTDYWDVTSRASRLGFKGSEDLGDGLKLIWKIENGVDISGENGSWSSRNRYIGLAGGWGTFLYGKHDTPAKMSTGKLDVFSDELGDYNAAAGIIDIRATDAIAYVSPSMGGLTLAGAVVPDGDYDNEDIRLNGVHFPGTADGGDFAGGYSLAAMYSNGGLFLAGAYEDLEDLAYGVEYNHWRIGAGFDMGAFHIGGVYQDVNLGNSDWDSYVINGSWAFGNNKLKAMYASVDHDVLDDTDSWAIGLDHTFSKRSKMYIQYADSERNLQDTNAVGEQSGVSMGMVHSF